MREARLRETKRILSRWGLQVLFSWGEYIDARWRYGLSVRRSVSSHFFTLAIDHGHERIELSVYKKGIA